MTREETVARLRRIQALYDRLSTTKVASKEYEQLIKMIREEADAFLRAM